MTDRPILFSSPMVRALLDGRKTQTRRIAKVVKDINIGCEIAPSELAAEVNAGNYENVKYAPGDRLWVRETWAAPHAYDGHAPSAIPADQRVYYAAENNLGGLMGRPSIFMPRWASRLTLTVSAVRMQRLNAISGNDAEAEGITIHMTGDVAVYKREADRKHEAQRRWNAYRIGQFKELWTSINGRDGPKSWAANPWIIAVTFGVHMTNIDALKVAA